MVGWQLTTHEGLLTFFGNENYRVKPNKIFAQRIRSYRVLKGFK